MKCKALGSGAWLNYLFFYFIFSRFYFPASGQAVWSQVLSLSPPRFLPSTFVLRRVQQSHCSSIFHRVLLTHAVALSASQFVPKKKSLRIYTSMYSERLELTKLTYFTRSEDSLIRHHGDRLLWFMYTLEGVSLRVYIWCVHKNAMLWVVLQGLFTPLVRTRVFIFLSPIDVTFYARTDPVRNLERKGT